MRAYREILRFPGALKFSSAAFLARSGGAMMGLGIVLMVSSLYGSYGLAGALAAANAASWAVGTAVLSNLVDRYGQRRVMFPAALVSAAGLSFVVAFALLQFPVWTLFAPVIISGATGGAPGAMVRARWTHLLDDPQLRHTAFSLESTLDEVVFMVGPVVATALATGVHPVAGLIAPIVTTALGAVLFYSQRSTEPPIFARTEQGSGATHRGLILLVPGVGAVIAVNLLIGCVFGAIDISVVAAATDWGVRAQSGLILAVFSLASALAGLLYGSRHWAQPLDRRFVVGVAAMFLTSLGLLTADSVLLLALTGALFGITIAPTLINGNALIERLVPKTRLTEGLAWMGTGIGIGASIGSSIAGQVIDVLGYHAGLITVVGFALLTALIAGASVQVLSRAVAAEPEELLETVPAQA